MITLSKAMHVNQWRSCKYVRDAVESLIWASGKVFGAVLKKMKYFSDKLQIPVWLVKAKKGKKGPFSWIVLPNEKAHQGIILFS